MKKSPTIKFVWRKFILSALVAAPLATLPSPLWALPSTGAGNVSSSVGASTVYSNPVAGTLNIHTPDKTVLTWTNFGAGGNTIASGETVNFDLDAATYGVLNIVTGGLTTIGGNITSLGNVYIINPAGITVSTGAVIGVANLGLSTATESPFNFQNTGTLIYPANTATGDINIAGTAAITAANNGTVTLVGKNINLVGTVIAGALNVTAQNANVTMGGATGFTLGVSGTKAGNLTVTTNGGNIDLANGAGAVTIYGGTATLNTTGAAGNGTVSQSSSGAFKVGAGGAAGSNGTLTINAGNAAVTLPAIDSSGGATGTLSVAVTAAGNTALTTDVGDITLNASSIAGTLAVTSAGKINSGGNTTVTGGVSLTTPAASNITFSGTGNLSFTKIANTGVATTNFSNTVALTSTGGTIALPTATDSTAGLVKYGTLSVTAAGAITNIGVQTIDVVTAATFSSGDNVTLSNPSAIPSLVVKNSPNGVTLTSTAAAVTLAKGSAATGNVTLTAPSFIFGGVSGDSMSFTNLSLTASAAGATTITDLSDTVTVTGITTLTPAATSSVQLDGNLGTGVGFASNFGQVVITNGVNATVFGKSALNLGAINISGNLLAIATAGNITNSGQLKIGGWVTAGAGTAAAPGNINLDFTAAAGNGNQITGTIYLQDDINQLLKTTVAGGATTIGNYMANNVTVMNENAIVMSPITNTYGTGIGGNLTLTGASVSLGNTIIGGAANLSSIGAITATGTNTIPTFNINDTKTAAGAVAVSVKSGGSTTVNATLSGAAGNGSTATFASGGNLTIGTVTSNYTGAVAFNATGGSVTDTAVGGLQIYGPVTFSASGNVAVTKGGDSFGAVTLDSSTDNSTVSLVENGTLNVASIGNGGKKIGISLTSQNGSIVEVTNAVIKDNADTSRTMSLSAPNGSIVLDQATNHAFAGQTNITVGATGNATYNDGASVILGNTSVAAGMLNIDVSSVANSKITQASGTTAYTYGSLILKAAGTGDITLANTGNQFGAYQIANATGNISVTEETTINLQSITTAGNLTITSNKGYILDSTNASLAPGFVTNGIVASGLGKVAKFTANATGGSINLSLPADSYTASVSLNTSGSASIVNNTANALDLSTSNVSGALSAINSATNQNITQSGTLIVAGSTSFVTGGSGGISLTNPNNQFGGLSIFAGTSGASIFEATTMNLLGGSTSFGNLNLSTAGNFITSGAGLSRVFGNLNISANGSVIPAPNSLYVTGTFTVYSIGTTDLSGLSKSGNLSSKNPVNSGPGTYIGPSN